MRYNTLMSIRKGLILLSLVSIVGTAIGYVLTNSIKYGICIANEIVTEASCISFYERVGNALYFGIGALAVVFFVLLFVPKAFGAWKKFAIWFVPLAVILLAVYPEPSDWDILPNPEVLAKWVSGIYVAISLVIIAIAAGKKTP